MQCQSNTINLGTGSKNLNYIILCILCHLLSMFVLLSIGDACRDIILREARVNSVGNYVTQDSISITPRCVQNT